jgi:hypothetical protein
MPKHAIDDSRATVYAALSSSARFLERFEALPFAVDGVTVQLASGNCGRERRLQILR